MRQRVTVLVAVLVSLAACAAMWSSIASASASGLAPGPARTTTAAATQSDTVGAEHDFVARINALRGSKGLGALDAHPELVALGRSWAQSMADVDRISHNPALADSVQADWQKLGENVGVGMTVERLHRAFVDSPTHYKNLVDPTFTHIGVGVVVGRDGALFTAHQFMHLRGAPVKAARTAAAPAEAAPAAEPASKPEPARESEPAEPAVPPARLVLVLEQLRELDTR